jgi:EAL domain-containing protein (putative c-di-GMP-specific phosphodiesterase class I)
MRRACLDIRQMSAMNKHFESVSINLSARQFVDHSIVDRIRLILEETGVSPDQLVIEITETIMMTETERSLMLLTELSKLGVKLSLDDFGTGYSSLAYLKQFPINVIKIDKSFIRDLHTNQSDSAICEAIIAIGHQLNLKVVAEGVETEEQYIYVRDKGCHSIQGYYFGKPLPISQLLCNISQA